MNNQIKLLRKELGLTMQEFGKNLGVSKSAISNIENGYNSLTDQMIVAICNAYNVNEEWLRTGNGEMFLESSDSLIEKIVSELPLDKLSQTILRTYIELEPKEREVFNHVMKIIANSIMEDGKEKAVNGVNDIIFNSTTPENVKKDMYRKAAMVFNEAFPYVGMGNFDMSNYGEEELSEKEKEQEWIDKEVEAYRKELEAERKGVEKSSLLDGQNDLSEDKKKRKSN